MCFKNENRKTVENMIRRLLVTMFLCMGCILWLSAQEVKTENFSINVGENHIDSLATVVSKSDSLVLHTDSLVSRLDSVVLKKDSLALVTDMKLVGWSARIQTVHLYATMKVKLPLKRLMTVCTG